MDASLLVALIGAIAVVLAAVIKLIGEVLKVLGSLISVWITHRMPKQERKAEWTPVMRGGDKTGRTQAACADDESTNRAMDSVVSDEVHV